MPGLIVHAEKASFPLPCITQASQQILFSAVALSPSLFNQAPESLKKAETREGKVNSFHPCSGSSRQRQVPGCALQRGATTEAPLHADPAAAGTARQGGYNSARGDCAFRSAGTGGFFFSL